MSISTTQQCAHHSSVSHSPNCLQPDSEQCRAPATACSDIQSGQTDSKKIDEGAAGNGAGAGTAGCGGGVMSVSPFGPAGLARRCGLVCSGGRGCNGCALVECAPTNVCSCRRRRACDEKGSDRKIGRLALFFIFRKRNFEQRKIHHKVATKEDDRQT